MSNILAIVGRPNVGKSTLFNRFTGMRQAIVEPTSGVTRDRHYGKSDWNGIEFSIIDTGGYIEGSDDVFEEEIRKQALLAIDESDVILFLVDVQEGLTPMDNDVAQLLRKCKKPVVLASNKADNTARYGQVHEFYALGLGTVYPVSAVNGGGTGDLLDEVVKHFNIDTIIPNDDIPRFAVVGRPNVGKSSLINALIGEERNIVTDVAGTTRDSIFTRYKSFGFDFHLVDTAGIRKKAKVKENIEFYSVMRSVRAIEHSDVCIVMIDAQTGVETQDLNIVSLALRNRKGVLIAVNKWDLIDKETNTTKTFEEEIRHKLAPFTDVPIVFTSVINKQRIHKTLELAAEVYKNRSTRITTSVLNETMQEVIESYGPPITKGKRIKIKYITQLKTPFPAFVFFCNLPQYIKDPYKRYLENKIRQQWCFTGIPIQLYFRKK